MPTLETCHDPDDFRKYLMHFIFSTITGPSSGNLDNIKDTTLIFPSVKKMSSKRVIETSDLKEEYLIRTSNAIQVINVLFEQLE